MKSGVQGDSPLLPPEGGSLAVVLLTGIGDVVHGLPVITALKASRPDLEITWIAEPAPADVTRHHPAVRRTVVFRKSQGLGGMARLFRELAREDEFHLTLNLQRYFKSIFPTLFTRAPVRVGLARDKTRDGVSLFNTHHLPSGPWKHTQDLFLDVLPLLGLPRPDAVEWNITFSAPEEAEARRYFRDRPPSHRIGLVVGTANPKKDWPAERYPLLVDALEREHGGCQVFLLGGPSERERAVARRIVETAAATPVCALSDSVRELMWKIRGMDLLISPDTAPVHLARAMEVPVVGLYGHSNPLRVGPYRAFHDLTVDRYTDPDEDPDPSKYEPRQGRMERISVEDVIARVRVARDRYHGG